jgi:membrane fusion protein (multidrug efflux system)
MLYRIEQAPFQAKFASAEGQLAAAKAQLASAQATLEDKQADFERQATLVKQGDVSKTAFDRAKAERDEAKAAVEEAKASIQQAQAGIESAEIDLGYTIIRSPIDGRIGATQYTQGNLVDSSSGTLATVVQLDPIRAVFSIPSSDFVKVQQRAAGATGKDKAQVQFVPELILPTGQTYPHQGKLAFVDNQVDPGTGTIAVYADFPNPDHLLLPGQFVTALVRSAEPQREPVVPAAAIQRTRDGAQVYLVGQDNRIAERQIKTGVQTGNGYAVTSGLQGGEIVVVSGIQKVKPGVKVKTVKQSEAAPMGKALSIDSSGSGSSGDAATDKADQPAGSHDGQSGDADGSDDSARTDSDPASGSDASGTSEGRPTQSTANAADDN